MVGLSGPPLSTGRWRGSRKTDRDGGASDTDGKPRKSEDPEAKRGGVCPPAVNPCVAVAHFIDKVQLYLNDSVGSLSTVSLEERYHYGHMKERPPF